MEAPLTPPSLRLESAPDGARSARLAGAWNLATLRASQRRLSRRLSALGRRQGVAWDLRDVELLDNAAAALLWRAWRRRRPAKLLLRSEHEALLGRLVDAPPAAPPPRTPWTEPLAVLGLRTGEFVSHLLGIVGLLGRIVLDLAEAARHPKHAPWREFSASLYRTGVTALPITALVGFLIGVVLSYLSAQQLRTFGANIFIVNLLGISIIRELGPLLAAIIVAGRSGSAMTAQLGVMRVTKELDALAALGISHSLRLVLPKVLALAVSLPLLVLWTDMLALWGGMAAAERELGIGYTLFLLTLPDVVPVSNLWLGVVKGAVFGVLIALIACHFGLRIEPNTQSLGARTTQSVVTSITAVILADAVFAILTAQGWLG